MNTYSQAGIMAELPVLSRYLTFNLIHPENAASVLEKLGQNMGENLVIGLGLPLVQVLSNKLVPGLKGFPGLSGPGVAIPATQAALWCWLRGDDRGKLLQRGRSIESMLAAAFELDNAVDGFKYAEGLDLTGYEDGTENPQGDDAVAAAIMQGESEGLNGSSFVAVQQWQHSLDSFDAKSQLEQDHTIGRRRSDNEELDDAPESAHVKRTAQEDFSPEAFVLRRSMPWVEGDRAGLVFVAFGRSFEAFEALLTRMLGIEDGITDALFSFTQPLTGAYFWCPPVHEGNLDLRYPGLN